MAGGRRNWISHHIMDPQEPLVAEFLSHHHARLLTEQPDATVVVTKVELVAKTLYLRPSEDHAHGGSEPGDGRPPMAQFS